MQRPHPAYRGDEPYLFVSYSHQDEASVYPEVHWLQEQGLRIWWDDGISPGAAWRGELTQALKGCEAILYFVSPNSVVSQQCIREINFALDEYQKPVIAVHLEPSDLPDELGLVLSGRQAIMRHQLPAADYERKLLDAAGEFLDQTPIDGASQRRPRRLPLSRQTAIGFAAGVLVAAAVAFTFWPRVSESPALPVRFALDLPDGSEVPPDVVYPISITPDGRQVLVQGSSGPFNRVLWSQALDGIGMSSLEMGDYRIGSQFMSSDGAWLAFHDGRSVRKIPLAGGPPSKISGNWVNQGSWLGGTWGPHGRVAFGGGPGGELLEVPATGGDPVPLTQPEPGERHRQPRYLPDASGILFVTIMDEASHISVLSFETGRQTVLLPGTSPHATRSHLLFQRDQALWAVGFDLRTHEVTTTPQHVIDDINVFGPLEMAQYVLSDEGTFLYVSRRDVDPTAEVAWVGRDGHEHALPLEPLSISQARVSPGGDALLLVITDSEGDADAWLYSRASGTVVRMTTSSRVALFSPLWHPDGSHFVYAEQNVHGYA